MRVIQDGWSSDTIKWIDQIVASGWDPFGPSKEAEREMARPRILQDLGWWDAACGQWFLCCVKLTTRFQRGEVLGDSERARMLHFLAHVWVMSEIKCGAECTPEVLRELIDDTMQWWEQVYTPASERLDVDDDRFGHEYVLANRQRYEPAFTIGLAHAQLRTSDLEADLRCMQHVLASYDGDSQLATIPLTIEQLGGYFKLAIRDGRVVSRVNDDGRWVLVPGKVLDGLQKNVHRPRVESRIVTETDLGAEVLSAAPVASPYSGPDLDRLEAAEAVAAAIEARSARKGGGRARAVAAANLRALASGATTIEEVARQAGLSGQAVGDAYHAELRAIRAQLRA